MGMTGYSLGWLTVAHMEEVWLQIVLQGGWRKSTRSKLRE